MAVDATKLAFASNAVYERVSLTGHSNFSVTVGAGFQTLTIPHGLGYIPFFRVFYTYNNGKYHQLFTGSQTYNLDGNGGQIDTMTIDATNLTVVIANFGASTINGVIYYRIYAERAV